MSTVTRGPTMVDPSRITDIDVLRAHLDRMNEAAFEQAKRIHGLSIEIKKMSLEMAQILAAHLTRNPERLVAELERLTAQYASAEAHQLATSESQRLTPTGDITRH